MKGKLVVIVGPTATGKTDLALELARRFQGEIIGADSRQVYRYMDIGTAKPLAEERAAVPYHLIDVVDPDASFSLGQWLDLAQKILEDVWSRPDGRPSGRGKPPLLVGGTGQYIWALLEGWRVPRVPPQPERRRQLEERAAREGTLALFQELVSSDPAAAQFIDGQNLRRVIRALEVLKATGKPFSYWRRKDPLPGETLIIGLELTREELYRRIDARVDKMIAGGLIGEVQRLLAMGYKRELPSMSGIGYKEVCQYLYGELDRETAVARIKTETHRLARHQNNWFKKNDPRIRWIEAQEGALEKASRLVGEFLETATLIRS